MALKSRRIDVRVDEVVLHGIAPADRERALAAVRTRLAEIAVGLDARSAASHAGERFDDGRVGRAAAPAAAAHFEDSPSVAGPSPTATVSNRARTAKAP